MSQTQLEATMLYAAPMRKVIINDFTWSTMLSGWGASVAAAISGTLGPRLLARTNRIGNYEFVMSETSPGVYRSPKGLIYEPGSKEGHRFTHVMEHA